MDVMALDPGDVQAFVIIACPNIYAARRHALVSVQSHRMEACMGIDHRWLMHPYVGERDRHRCIVQASLFSFFLVPLIFQIIQENWDSWAMLSSSLLWTVGEATKSKEISSKKKTKSKEMGLTNSLVRWPRKCSRFCQNKKKVFPRWAQVSEWASCLSG